jgi:molecular chaperone HscB
MAGYFALLGLPERFELDRKEIEHAYLERSKETHPDRFASAPSAERLVAVQRSVALNDAYQTLKKPVRRAEYLLAQRGLTIGDNERIADHEFLMKVLALREELSEQRAADNLAEVARLQQTMKSYHHALVDGLAPRFAAGDLEAVKQSLIELRYVDRYLEECDAALDEDAA